MQKRCSSIIDVHQTCVRVCACINIVRCIGACFHECACVLASLREVWQKRKLELAHLTNVHHPHQRSGRETTDKTWPAGQGGWSRSRSVWKLVTALLRVINFPTLAAWQWQYDQDAPGPLHRLWFRSCRWREGLWGREGARRVMAETSNSSCMSLRWMIEWL